MGKFNLKRAIQIGSCVLAAVMAYASTASEQKQAAELAELKIRVANLESK